MPGPSITQASAEHSHGTDRPISLSRITTVPRSIAAPAYGDARAFVIAVDCAKADAGSRIAAKANKRSFILINKTFR